MTSDPDINVEPLPGYRLIEKIGAGGYGEVWRAEAPGGLTKAIKFVFGQQHEKRATNELRALDHVRSVRHPFLLSLERIEVVDGRLLVVTELADESVKDRFDACRRQGQPGIPRAELLGYLRDAADALDFMNESHALQHLDIKPENLLLLAGHVKVADFGLVKDVRQSQASLVGGMTPLYAAPEVFKGTPSRQSDQYSLAIVYQEMLTGTLPFAGGNSAELTLQHLNDEPDMSALSGSDRYVVSRALSKDPQHRYLTCREFIEALLKATDSIVSFAGGGTGDADVAEPAKFSPPPAVPNVPTDVFEDCESPWSSQPRQMLVELPAADSRVVDLPPVDVTGVDLHAKPSLVLGIGGTAGRVLAQFRKRIHDEYGEAGVPAVQLLLLDTDSRALADAGRREGTALTPDEMLSLPLRRPQHYREHAQQLLTWLSRRWLYNIPRTLRTEGLRPLGRLALADHARQAGQRIRQAMTQALDAQLHAISSQAIGREFRGDALRVFVVASISGGTGGGMALDVGYAVRAILNKMGVKDARVCGLMMHSTGGDPRHCELARVNALSWLTEFHHFQQANNAYPGDASCGLPAHAAGVPAFDDTYLIHLGENLNEVEFTQATQSVAEYIRLRTVTQAAGVIDAPGASSEDAPEFPGGPTRPLRSFGLYHRSAAPSEFCDEFAHQVSQAVILNWRKVDRSPTETAPIGSQLVRRLQLDSTGIAANVRALVEAELGAEPSVFLSSWQATHGGEAATDQFKTIDKIFAPANSDAPAGGEFTLRGRPASVLVAPLAEKLRGEIRRWATSRIDDPRERVEGARRGIAWLQEHCKAIENDFARLASQIVDKLLELRREANQPSSPGTPGVAPCTPESRARRALDYFRLRLDQLSAAAGRNTVHLLLCDAKGLMDEITAFGREIDQIAAAVSRSATGESENRRASRGGAGSTRALAEKLEAKLPEIATEVDARLQAEYIHLQGGLLKMVMQGGRPRAQLSAKLHELSRQAVQKYVAGVNVMEQALSAGGGQANTELQSALAAATPALLEFGGTRRVLAVLPRDAAGTLTAATISNAISAPASAVAGSDNNLTLCVEADRLSLPHIAAALVEHRRDRVEFAGRVHCRTDVDWLPLIDVSATPEPAALPDFTSRQTPSRDAMCKTLVM